MTKRMLPCTSVALIVAATSVAVAQDTTLREYDSPPEVNVREVALLKAIAGGNLEEVKKAAHGMNVTKVTNLPYWALASRNADVVEFLREAGDCQITDLQIAAMRGDLAEVDKLLAPLDKKARSEALAVWSDPFCSYSPLSLAVRNGHTLVVRALVAHGANVNEGARETHTPLANAAELGHTEVVRSLLKAGARVNQEADGYTPLMRACIGGQKPAAELLLTAGADPNLARHDGRRALHFAALKGNVDCVQLLLKHGADASAVAYGKDTALTYAELYKHEVVVRILREDSR